MRLYAPAISTHTRMHAYSRIRFISSVGDYRGAVLSVLLRVAWFRYRDVQANASKPVDWVNPAQPDLPLDHIWETDE